MAARRAQLAGFLKARRAGVGLSWYTWLEQARDITPSAQVLLALSRALELSAPEQAHLFLLAGVAGPEGPDRPENEVDEQTAALVHALLPHIAYVLSPRFDILVHNRAAEIILGDLVTRPPGRRNLLLWQFDGQTDWSREPKDWEASAQANLMDFRTEYARHPDDPSYQRLIDELTLLNRRRTRRSWWPGTRRLARSRRGAGSSRYASTGCPGRRRS